MTLYTFKNDTKGVSKCTGNCAVAWPPAIATSTPTLPSGTAGTLDLITRPDAPSKQITYNGLPLYFFAADTAPGDTKGEGVGGNWKVAAVTAS